jgi:uncharacterized CHY-type Zn-finger protein
MSNYKHDFYQDDNKNTTWLGEIVDIEDPLKNGRVKIKVFGKFDLLEKDDIPWAYPANISGAGSPSGGSSFSVPKLGSIVSVKFDNGNIYHPEYYFHQKLSDEALTEIENSYANSHIIVYDTVTEGSLKIFFTEEKGLMIDYKETQINIKPDKSVNITTVEPVNVKCKSMIVDHAESIELGKGASEKAVLGDAFMQLFNQHTHIGNMGAPTSPPTVPMSPAQHLSGKGANPVVKIK